MDKQEKIDYLNRVNFRDGIYKKVKVPIEVCIKNLNERIAKEEKMYQSKKYTNLKPLFNRNYPLWMS